MAPIRPIQFVKVLVQHFCLYPHSCWDTPAVCPVQPLFHLFLHFQFSVPTECGSAGLHCGQEAHVAEDLLMTRFSVQGSKISGWFPGHSYSQHFSLVNFCLSGVQYFKGKALGSILSVDIQELTHSIYHVWILNSFWLVGTISIKTVCRQSQLLALF